ncbi:MAG: bpX6 domain-containing protein [Pseudomonas sp.]|nr:bpX6 domain-containing protein [Pseudomonas sp.]
MNHALDTAVRRPVLRGQQAVAGLWLPAERFAEPERIRLLLEHWQAGASAWRFEQGDLLRWREPQRLHCEQLLGWPLVLSGATLCSAPLADTERAGLAAADLWLVRDSQVVALHLADAQVLHPGQWLNIDGYSLLDTFDCSPALPAPLLQPLAVRSDIREILGEAVGAPDPAREEVMRAMAQRAQQGPPEKPGTGRVGLSVKVVFGLFAAWAVFGLLPRLLQPAAPLAEVAEVSHTSPTTSTSWLLFILVFGIFAGMAAMIGGKSSPGPSGRAPGTAPAPVKPAAAGIPARKPKGRFTPGFVDRWLTRLASASRLNRLFGKRQADYLQRMLAMFEEGDLNEALRHAIPLGDQPGDSLQAFGTPQRRTELELSQQRGAGRSIGLADDFRDHLRTMYRKSFEKLDREGRVDEAVFVLAELLKVRQEALDYLERHQRYAQSAELALAWDMPPAVIVRHLCLADDWQRALLVARRDNAFAAAVTALEAKWPEQAGRLRLEWAQALAAQGQWLMAVDVVWSLPQERARAADWLRSAEAGGERLAAEALVKRALLLPDTLQAYEAYLLALRDDPARQAERLAIGRALLANKQSSRACTWLAAALAGALVADRQLPAAQVQKLIKLSNDSLLQADMPKLNFSPMATVALRAVAQPCQWQAPTAGARAIIDAVALDDGRSLVALGEAGALVLDAQGRTLGQFAVPAQHLVLAESRQVALAVIRRGEVWRVSKLDLANRTVHDLGVVAMDDFARQFDGIGWTIGKADHVRVVDVDNGLGTLWHVDQLPGKVLGVFADASNEHLLLQDAHGGLQRWRYRLPDRRLQARDELTLAGRDGATLAFGLAGEPIEYWLNHPEADPVIMLEHGGRCAGYNLPGLDREAIDWPSIYLGRDWLVVVYWAEGGHQHLRFFNRADDRHYATLHWPGREHVGVRCVAGQWTVFDGQGRLFCLNVEDAWPRTLSLY